MDINGLHQEARQMTPIRTQTQSQTGLKVIVKIRVKTGEEIVVHQITEETVTPHLVHPEVHPKVHPEAHQEVHQGTHHVAHQEIHPEAHLDLTTTTPMTTTPTIETDDVEHQTCSMQIVTHGSLDINHRDNTGILQKMIAKKRFSGNSRMSNLTTPTRLSTGTNFKQLSKLSSVADEFETERNFFTF